MAKKLCAYELQRLANIEANQRVLEELGLIKDKPGNGSIKKKAKKEHSEQREQQEQQPRRTSRRLQDKPLIHCQEQQNSSLSSRVRLYLKWNDGINRPSNTNGSNNGINNGSNNGSKHGVSKKYASSASENEDSGSEYSYKSDSEDSNSDDYDSDVSDEEETKLTYRQVLTFVLGPKLLKMEVDTVPFKLKRFLNTLHAIKTKKPLDYFLAILCKIEKQKGSSALVAFLKQISLFHKDFASFWSEWKKANSNAKSMRTAANLQKSQTSVHSGVQVQPHVSLGLVIDRLGWNKSSLTSSTPTATQQCSYAEALFFILQPENFHLTNEYFTVQLTNYLQTHFFPRVKGQDRKYTFHLFFTRLNAVNPEMMKNFVKNTNLDHHDFFELMKKYKENTMDASML